MRYQNLICLCLLFVSNALLHADNLSELKAAAEAGDTEAMLELALYYDSHDAEQPDPAQAAIYYQQAATLGDGFAHWQLGQLYEKGRGVPQSYEQARLHYEQAIALGTREANLHLGLLHFAGSGVPANLAKAKELIERAAQANYCPAQIILSDMYAAGLTPEKKGNRGLALFWAEKAAAGQSPEGQNRLGRRLSELSRKKKELPTLARDWFQTAAQNEHTQSLVDMAASFIAPNRAFIEDPMSITMARHWLELAIESGHAEAPFILALINAKTRVNKANQSDIEETRRLLALALERMPFHAKSIAVLHKLDEGYSDTEAFNYALSTQDTELYIEYISPKTPSSEQTTHGPIVIHAVEPEYPMVMRLTQTGGVVLVRFTVDRQGNVVDPVVEESTHPAFSENALIAIKQWKFKPARKDGEPVCTRSAVPMTFKMRDFDYEEASK